MREIYIQLPTASDLFSTKNFIILTKNLKKLLEKCFCLPPILLTFSEIISQIFKYHTIKKKFKPCQQQQVNISQHNLTVEQTRDGLGTKMINITGQLSNERKSIQYLHLTRSCCSHILEVYCLLLALLVRERRHNG